MNNGIYTAGFLSGLAVATVGLYFGPFVAMAAWIVLRMLSAFVLQAIGAEKAVHS